MSNRVKKEWIVTKRTSDVKRPCYYAGFLKPDGKYRIVVLHDSLGHRVLNKTTAEILALKLWQDGVPGASEGFGPFLESFWAVDGTYARDKRDQGDPLSACYQANSYNSVRLHVRPALRKAGKDLLPVDRVTPELLRAILRAVGDKGLKGRTVNTVRQTFAVPLRAYWEGKLHPERNPCTARLVPHFDDTPAARQIFTLGEARQFLALDFGDPRLTAIQWQMTFTGMRLGECLGMQHGDIGTESVRVGRSVVTEYWIDVQHNWQEREPVGRRVKGPKKGSFGNVPLPAAVAERLLRLQKASPYGGPFLYWGFAPDRAYPKDKVERSYNSACVKIGITDTERKRRGLGPHAWRHFFDTYVNIDRNVLQKLMRHRTPEMTARYSHLTDDQRRSAFRASSGLLLAVEKKKNG